MLFWVSLVSQLVKNLPVMGETWVQSLGWKVPGERKGYPLQCSGLENPMDGCTTGAPSQVDVHYPEPQEVLVSKEACLQFYR